jgi:hypothetical protein
MTPTELAEAILRLKALKKARDSGVLRVEHQGTSTTYRSLQEINDIISALTGEISTAQGATRGPSYIRQTGRGL